MVRVAALQGLRQAFPFGVAPRTSCRRVVAAAREMTVPEDRHIFRIERKTRNFTIIDNGLLNDRRLSLKARGLLAMLLSKPPTWRVRLRQIARSGPDGITALRSALQELRAFGYAIVKASRAGGGRLDGAEWLIFEEPRVGATDAQVSRTSVPTRRFPERRESRTPGNGAQLNTDPKKGSKKAAARTEGDAAALDASRRAEKEKTEPDLAAFPLGSRWRLRTRDGEVAGAIVARNGRGPAFLPDGKPAATAIALSIVGADLLPEKTQ